MRILIDRGLSNAAFNVAKLLYHLDPASDPLAILLVIDTLAIRANQPHVVLQIYEALKVCFLNICCSVLQRFIVLVLRITFFCCFRQV